MSETPDNAYQQLVKHARETACLTSVESLLNWDERTLMPPAAADYRGEQLAFLAGVVHDRRTDPRVGDWLTILTESDLAADPHCVTGVNIREMKRHYDRQVKLPKRLVEELTRAAVVGQQTWQLARENDDFVSFAPVLENIVRLKREEAEALGHDGNPYDPLLDEFEPGETTENVTRVLAALREELVPFIAAVRDSDRRPDAGILTRPFPAAPQAAFVRQAAEMIGFDLGAGRLDETAHPFCSGMGPRDCRITTRYNETFFPSALFGTLHEAGHGIYEQGLPADHYGLPAGEAVSLGIHESQSRMWENLVGRSRPFWEHFFGPLQAACPAMRDVALDDFWFAVNEVKPSLIRIEADEATYNLHILVRFELEQALVRGDLAVNDLPEAWNEKYRHYLGIVPSNDADGVLQDIHWSSTAIGYFSTYSLGNLYASQFFDKADEDLGGLHEQFGRGEFTPLREWLRENIHARGQRYTAAQLVEHVTGKPLSHEPLMRHLRTTLGGLYGVS